MEKFLEFLIAPSISAFLTGLLFTRLNWRWQETYTSKLNAYNEITEILSHFQVAEYDLHHVSKVINSQMFAQMTRAQRLIYLHFSKKAYSLFKQVYGLGILSPNDEQNYVCDDHNNKLTKDQYKDKIEELFKALKSELSDSNKIFWLF